MTSFGIECIIGLLDVQASSKKILEPKKISSLISSLYKTKLVESDTDDYR